MPVIIGRDVTVYTLSGQGPATFGAGPVPSSSANMLGSWESCRLEVNYELFKTTSSDGAIVERRQGPVDWKLTANLQVRGGGSQALATVINNGWAGVIFQDTISGKTITVVGLIDSSSFDGQQEGFKDSIVIVANGAQSTLDYQ